MLRKPAVITVTLAIAATPAQMSVGWQLLSFNSSGSNPATQSTMLSTQNARGGNLALTYAATSVQITGKVVPNAAPVLVPNGASEVFYPQVPDCGRAISSRSTGRDSLPNDIRGHPRRCPRR